MKRFLSLLLALLICLIPLAVPAEEAGTVSKTMIPSGNWQNPTALSWAVLSVPRT